MHITVVWTMLIALGGAALLVFAPRPPRAARGPPSPPVGAELVLPMMLMRGVRCFTEGREVSAGWVSAPRSSLEMPR